MANVVEGQDNFWQLKPLEKSLTNTIFDDPLIVNQDFLQNEYFIGKSDFAHIKNFH